VNNFLVRIYYYTVLYNVVIRIETFNVDVFDPEESKPYGVY